MAIEFTLNGKRQSVDVVPQMPLLWVLRDTLGLTGTKFGCGMALCGACTVHINGQPTRSCTLPISMVAGKSVTTIEGLSADSSHPIQKAWVEVDVPQCGYCQSGQIMAAFRLLPRLYGEIYRIGCNFVTTSSVPAGPGTPAVGETPSGA